MADAKVIACALLRQIEGLKLEAYPDPGTGGKPWTIGYGNTAHLDGAPVKPGDRLRDAAEADQLMQHALGLIEPKLDAMVKVALESCQKGALLSWQYNIGSTAARTSTLIRKLNAGDKLGAADQFAVWNVSGGKVMKGLINRRKLERAVFLGKVDLVGSSPAAAKPTAKAVASAAADLNAAELARVKAGSAEA